MGAAGIRSQQDGPKPRDDSPMPPARSLETTMASDELEPIDPETALKMYLSAREREVAQSTLRAHRSRLGHFLRWCDQQDIDNLNLLTGRDIHQYRLWRRNEADLSTSTEKTQMDPSACSSAGSAPSSPSTATSTRRCSRPC
jgi:hypothetical protein